MTSCKKHLTVHSKSVEAFFKAILQNYVIAAVDPGYKDCQVHNLLACTRPKVILSSPKTFLTGRINNYLIYYN